MKSSAEFECECKVKTVFDFNLPEIWKPVLHDVTCKGRKGEGCDAIWTMKFRKKLDGLVSYTFRLKTPSAKLAAYLKKKKYDEIINAPQKKSPIFVVPGFRK